MSVVAMIGPHAVGKTTAAKRWALRYGDRLGVVSMDDQRKRLPDDAAKVAEVERLRADRRVWVVESARGFSAWLKVLRAGDHALVLTTPQAVAREWWTARKGSPPDPSYWTPRRLEYETVSYMLAKAEAMESAGVAVHVVGISDRARDWAAADELFGRMFRALHNSRGRR